MTLARHPVARSLLAGALVTLSPIVGVVAAQLAGTALGIPVTSGASSVVFVVALFGTLGLAIAIAERLDGGA